MLDNLPKVELNVSRESKVVTRYTDRLASVIPAVLQDNQMTSPNNTETLHYGHTANMLNNCHIQHKISIHI